MGAMRRRLAALLTVRLAASLAPPSPPTNQLVPSPLVFGTLRLHEAPQPFQLLTKAWDLGIAAFDTAAVYGGGESERILGAWLRDAATPPDARRNAVVISKGGCGPPSSGWAPRLDRRDLERELDESLRRLGRVDVYLLHRDDPAKDISEIVDNVSQLCAARGVKTWGCSNWSTRRFAAARRYAVETGQAPPRCASVQESLATPRHAPWPGTTCMGKTDRRWYADHRDDVVVVGWECLAKGFLAGRWSRDDMFAPSAPLPPDEPADDYESWRDARLRSAYLTPENFARRDRARRLGQVHGLAAEHVALAWARHQPYASRVCVATTSVARLADDARALSLPLSPSDLAWLESGDPALLPARLRSRVKVR